MMGVEKGGCTYIYSLSSSDMCSSKYPICCPDPCFWPHFFQVVHVHKTPIFGLCQYLSSLFNVLIDTFSLQDQFLRSPPPWQSSSPFSGFHWQFSSQFWHLHRRYILATIWGVRIRNLQRTPQKRRQTLSTPPPPPPFWLWPFLRQRSLLCQAMP